MPEGNDNWGRETHQRNAIIRGIQFLNPNNDDIIFISDLDEIIDPLIITKIKNNTLNTIYSLKLDLYYYNLNCFITSNWTAAKVLNFGSLNNTIDNIRRGYYPLINEPCGWHLSYFGDTNFIINKIQQFSHQEYNNPTYTNKDVIEDLIKNNKDLFYRNDINITFIPISENKYLPTNYKLV
jgi:beta-1,4-mannosyl-glycoprotein beta-1,4-N-acetylglucosaminyltransferase